MSQSNDDRRRKQKELDSMLDAALDELDESDNDENDDNNDDYDDSPVLGPIGSIHSSNDGSSSSTSNNEAPNNEVTNASCSEKDSIESIPNTQPKRPVFGPEPPPKYDPKLPPSSGNGLSNEETELAASLEGMMQQFLNAGGGGVGGNGIPSGSGGLSGLGGLDALGSEADGLAELENAEKALDDMFQKMMGNDFAAAAAAPSSPPKTKSKPKKTNSASTNNNKNNKSTEQMTPTAKPTQPTHTAQTTETASPAHTVQPTTQKQSPTKTPRKANPKNQPLDVDQSINKLLHNLNQASTTNPTEMAHNLASSNHPSDPSEFEHLEQLGEDMMNSVMKEFEKMNTANDANDVVDGVMKQLLDKDLMYEPMKQVMVRFPKWLAEHKGEIEEEEYERYGKQYQYFQRIVRVYETEPDNFPRLMELMQDIQEYGQPPVEIIKELAPDLDFDDEGMPIMGPDMGGIPGMPFPGNEQCNVM